MKYVITHYRYAVTTVLHTVVSSGNLCVLVWTLSGSISSSSFGQEKCFKVEMWFGGEQSRAEQSRKINFLVPSATMATQSKAA